MTNTCLKQGLWVEGGVAFVDAGRPFRLSQMDWWMLEMRVSAYASAYSSAALTFHMRMLIQFEKGIQNKGQCTWRKRWKWKHPTSCRLEWHMADAFRACDELSDTVHTQCLGRLGGGQIDSFFIICIQQVQKQHWKLYSHWVLQNNNNSFEAFSVLFVITLNEWDFLVCYEII